MRKYFHLIAITFFGGFFGFLFNVVNQSLVLQYEVKEQTIHEETLAILSPFHFWHELSKLPTTENSSQVQVELYADGMKSKITQGQFLLLQTGPEQSFEIDTRKKIAREVQSQRQVQTKKWIWSGEQRCLKKEACVRMVWFEPSSQSRLLVELELNPEQAPELLLKNQFANDELYLIDIRNRYPQSVITQIEVREKSRDAFHWELATTRLISVKRAWLLPQDFEVPKTYKRMISRDRLPAAVKKQLQPAPGAQEIILDRSRPIYADPKKGQQLEVKPENPIFATPMREGFSSKP